MTTTLRRIHIDDVPAIARGAAVLGSGGGGDPHIGRLMAEQALEQHGPVTLVQPTDLPDDAIIFPVAMMGAPTVMVEKLPATAQFAAAIRTLAKFLDRSPTHVACAEAGGVNSTIPIIAAAELGLPLVDGDLMGRAFPELQMVLPTLSDIPGTPMSISDEKGNTGILATVDNAWSERLARAVTIEMGCSAIISSFVMDGTTLRKNMVPGTLSLCHALGEAITTARTSHLDPVDALTQTLGGRKLFSGKVIDVARRTVTGFARGAATIAPTGDEQDTLVLEFQNEHLMATRHGTDGDQVEATTPDLIIVLDADTGEPIPTEALRYGQRVTVIGAPCDDRWHTTAGIKLVGPRYFGYPTDPVRAIPNKNISQRDMVTS